MLGLLGYDIELAEDGASAIKLYKQAKKSGDPFDVIILDLTNPGGMGGKETIEKLLTIDPKVKALVSSGYSNDPIMSKFRDYGFSGVITKPYRLHEVSKIIHNVLMK
jgi:CheY-like chemotaxis protein